MFSQPARTEREDRALGRNDAGQRGRPGVFPELLISRSEVVAAQELTVEFVDLVDGHDQVIPSRLLALPYGLGEGIGGQ